MRRMFFTWAMTGFAMLMPAWAFAADQEMAQQIASSLRNSGKLKGYSINVKVQEGIVQMEGTVRSAKQLDDALAIAESTPGIERVVNNLSVKGETQAVGPGLQQPGLQQPGLASKTSRRMPVGSTVRQASAETHESNSPLSYDEPVLSAPTEPSVSNDLAPSGVMSSMPAARPMIPTQMNAARSMQKPAGKPAPLAMQPPAMPPQMGMQQTSAMQQMPMQGQLPQQQMAQAQMARANMARQPELIPQGPVNGPVGPGPMAGPGGPMPAYANPVPGGVAPARYDHPNMPNYAWPSYAAYPNYAAVTYPKQYSATAWPFIGPFYPYPQVPLGWRKVSLEWDHGWWMLDFKD